MADYGEPLFGFLEDFREETEVLRGHNANLQMELDSCEISLRITRRVNDDLRAEIKKRDEDHKTERENLAEWLVRRIAQQEEAMTPSYISGETKRVMEIEVSMLRRYREIIVGSAHTKGNDDPLMPKFV